MSDEPKITSKTLIPVGLALSTIGGGSAWMANVQSQAASHEHRITKVELNQEQYSQDMQFVRENLVEISTTLKFLKRQKRQPQGDE